VGDGVAVGRAVATGSGSAACGGAISAEQATSANTMIDVRTNQVSPVFMCHSSNLVWMSCFSLAQALVVGSELLS
jgi:hypothetical protein